MVGGGAQHASAEVLELAEHLQAPVVAFRSGRGIVSSDHPLGLTCAEAFELWDGTDVVLGIGSRLELQWFRWGPAPAGLKTILVDIDPRQMRGCARRCGSSPTRPRPPRRSRARSARWRPTRGRRATRRCTRSRPASASAWREIQPHAGYLRAIRDVLPRDGFFVEEICQAGFTSYFALPVYQPRTFVTCGLPGHPRLRLSRPRWA